MMESISTAEVRKEPQLVNVHQCACGWPAEDHDIRCARCIEQDEIEAWEVEDDFYFELSRTV